MFMLKIKIKYLPYWTPVLVLLQWKDSHPRCQGHTDSCMCWSVFFLKNLEGMYPWPVWCSLFWQDLKLCWKLCFSGGVSQRNLASRLLGYGPQCGLIKLRIKTLFYSCYWSFTFIDTAEGTGHQPQFVLSIRISYIQRKHASAKKMPYAALRVASSNI